METHLDYQSRELQATTRIQMLLGLYSEAQLSIERATLAHASGDSVTHNTELQRARRLVLGLLAGVDRDQELGDQLYRLLVFVVRCLAEQQLRPAEKILTILQSAFEEIKDDAISMELRGEIPGMDKTRRMLCEA